MANQFTTKGMARGTKLTTQHLYNPLNVVKLGLEGAGITGVTEGIAPWRMTWCIAKIESAAFETADATLQFPFVMPPYQQDFNGTTLQPPTNSPIMTELSVSFDQKAEALGITDEYCTSTPGSLSKCDMTRYTIKLRLLERTPVIFQGVTPPPNSQTSFVEVATFEIPGDQAFGNPYANNNPLQINDLQVTLNPLRSYCWVLSIPGLYSTDNTQHDNLCTPNFVLSMRGTYPLTMRDYDDVHDPADPLVQNIPTKHYGQKQTGIITLPVPSANAIITGESDLQGAFGTFDQILLNKLNSGYGPGNGSALVRGLEADTAPWEQLAKDAAYSAIVVPLWSNWEDIRASDIGATNLIGIPYLGGGGTPYLDPTVDRRIIRVPNNFVVHHVIACWNLTSAPSPTSRGHIGWGTFPASPTLTHAVGVAISNGLHGDDYQYQQVAYADWTGTNYTTGMIDTFKLDGTHTQWVMMHVPLVWPNPGPTVDHSYYTTGRPFYMGGGNSTTQTRTKCGHMPTNYGAGALQDPLTGGGETFLEVRWSMQDAISGLDESGMPNYTLVGYGGHQVILIGKQVLGA